LNDEYRRLQSQQPGNENKVDLTKAVPKITFPGFCKVVKTGLIMIFYYRWEVSHHESIIELQINCNDRGDMRHTEIKKAIYKV
jgi:hypothetical protein